MTTQYRKARQDLQMGLGGISFCLLVLCDMGLPKIGGLDAFKIKKELHPSVKVVFANSYLDPELKVEILKSGAIDFVQKSYDPDVIIKHIREVIDSSKS